MGVTLYDLANDDRWVDCNWWNWRPTIEILRLSKLFDDDRLELMGYNGCAEVSEVEARSVARYLEERILPALRTGDRVLLDGQITDEPDDFEFYREPAKHVRNYSATETWLREFAAFCQECGGFRVG